MRDKLPKGLLGDLAVMGVRDRLLKAEEAFQGADIVHVEELSLWFGVQPAELKRRLGFKLVSTVWETLPLGDAYRPPHGRAARERILDAVDLYLPATERARDALLLEGVPASASRSPTRASTSSASPAGAAPRSWTRRDPLAGPPGVGEGPPRRPACRRRAASRPRRGRAGAPAGAPRGRRPGGEAAARARGRARHRRHRRALATALRRDARPVRERFLPRARQPPAQRLRALSGRCAALLLGGAVRARAGRGDGGRAAARAQHLGRDPRGHARRRRGLLRARGLHGAGPRAGRGAALAPAGRARAAPARARRPLLAGRGRRADRGGVQRLT